MSESAGICDPPARPSARTTSTALPLDKIQFPSFSSPLSPLSHPDSATVPYAGAPPFIDEDSLVARTKARTLADINAQIERLKSEADALRAAEVAEVVGRIKQAIAHYDLSAEDLGFTSRRGRKPGRKAAASVAAAPTKKAKRGAKAAKANGAIKYEDGTGNTWTGRGRRPQWFLDATNAGKSAEDLLVKPAAG